MYMYLERLTELAIGAQRTAGEGRTVLGRPNPKSETIRDYNLNKDLILRTKKLKRYLYAAALHPL